MSAFIIDKECFLGKLGNIQSALPGVSNLGPLEAEVSAELPHFLFSLSPENYKSIDPIIS